MQSHLRNKRKEPAFPLPGYESHLSIEFSFLLLLVVFLKNLLFNAFLKMKKGDKTTFFPY
jgi:hypothetical protein